MGFFDRWRGREQRASIEDPRVPISSPNIITFLGLDAISASGETVTIDSAMGVPAVWAAVNFMSGTLAGLPLHVYRRTDEGRERVKGGLATILHDAVNDETSSFEWRKHCFDQAFTGGRAYSFIERSAGRKVTNLWPLDPTKTVVKRESGRKFYQYKDGSRTHRYDAAEIIDIPFMLKSDMLQHRSPILANKDIIGLAQAVTKYGAKFFQNGGVPPFVIEGPFQSPGAMTRAAEDLSAAVQKAAKDNRLALSLPAGHTLKQIGVDPEKSQLVELQRFIIEQIARIYSLPPTFLQDLTHGTFSNTEQQDLHFVKHTLKRWVEQFEQELNLKLFGRGNTRQYCEANVDGLLRGDFKTRMEGNARAIQTGQLTPNEARAMDNRKAMPNGDDLLIQGATVPLGTQPVMPVPANDNDEPKADAA
ncbi:phage portal protein [Allomesorhizobium alhagi]|uniref:Portal protein, HK97 family n=1 Tax=Mesorhizobium alhagi CCNWXJ12-2 TaxID=1107882 RepID=H0HR48_9HYPH|nr:phage portal protein [Mesorhizobium alhagi]EHK56828.1 portal protein, HK97 family [Mesorhizobium alhagi CCNWXJ12-2]